MHEVRCLKVSMCVCVYIGFLLKFARCICGVLLWGDETYIENLQTDRPTDRQTDRQTSGNTNSIFASTGSA